MEEVDHKLDVRLVFEALDDHVGQGRLEVGELLVEGDRHDGDRVVLEEETAGDDLAQDEVDACPHLNVDRRLEHDLVDVVDVVREEHLDPREVDVKQRGEREDGWRNGVGRVEDGDDAGVEVGEVLVRERRRRRIPEEELEQRLGGEDDRLMIELRVDDHRLEEKLAVELEDDVAIADGLGEAVERLDEQLEGVGRAERDVVRLLQAVADEAGEAEEGVVDEGRGELDLERLDDVVQVEREPLQRELDGLVVGPQVPHDRVVERLLQRVPLRDRLDLVGPVAVALPDNLPQPHVEDLGRHPRLVEGEDRQLELREEVRRVLGEEGVLEVLLADADQGLDDHVVDLGGEGEVPGAVDRADERQDLDGDCVADVLLIEVRRRRVDEEERHVLEDRLCVSRAPRARCLKRRCRFEK